MTKERNYVVLALLRARKTTAIHGKTNKAKRRKEKIQILKDAWEG